MHNTETALRNALQTIRGQMTATSTAAPFLTTEQLVGLIDDALALPEVPVALPYPESNGHYGYLIIDSGGGEVTYCDDAVRVEDHLNELFAMNGADLKDVEVLKIMRTRQMSYEVSVKLTGG